MSRLALALAVTVCSLTTQARAVTITWEFSATVRGSIGAPLTGADLLFYREGQVISGSLTFESTATDGNASTTTGSYALGSVHMDYGLGVDPFPPGPFAFGDLLSSAPSGITVLNISAHPSSIDRMFVEGTLDLATFSPVGGPPPSFATFVLALYYLPALAGGAEFLSGDQLPIEPPLAAGLLPFDLQNVCGLSAATNLCFRSAGGSLVGAELTLLRPVPEPALAGLALAAIAALACFRRGSRGSIAG